MERETKSFKIASGAEFIIKTYLTGRETRELNRTYFRQAEDFSKDEIALKGLNGARFEQVQNDGFKQVIVSINGQKDGDVVEGSDKKFSVIDFILDLKKSEFNEVVANVNEVINDKRNSEEKKTP